MHPYELQQLARQRGKDLLAEHKSGSLYGVIERLVAERLIEPEAVNRAGRLPERTVYRVTSAGRDRLAEWLAAELGSLDARDLPRFGFALEKVVHLAPEQAVELLRSRLAGVEAQLGELRSALASGRVRELPRVAMVEVEYALAVRLAEAEWTRSLVADLASGELTWAVSGKDLES